MPVTYDLDEVLSTAATKPIDSEIVQSILSSPPFISLPGLFNARDLSDDTLSEVRSNYIYRSGSLESLTATGGQAFISLDIAHIFDLRSERERKSAPEPDLPGISFSWHPSTYDDPTNPTHITATTYRDANSGEYSLVQMYLDMLTSHRESFKAVFDHILNHPDKPFLFHCTAGKDRTGLLAALILGLAGVSLDYINRDYALTRVGVEPVREFLLQKWRKSNPDADEGSKDTQSALRFP